MSGLKGITINTDPAAEAHVYAEDDAAIYQSIFGSDGVLTIGQQCESQVISNNKVRVKDGVIVVGGAYSPDTVWRLLRLRDRERAVW